MSLFRKLFKPRRRYAVIYYVGYPGPPISHVAGPFTSTSKALAARDNMRRSQYQRGVRWDHAHLAHALPLDQ